MGEARGSGLSPSLQDAGGLDANRSSSRFPLMEGGLGLSSLLPASTAQVLVCAKCSLLRAGKQGGRNPVRSLQAGWEREVARGPGPARRIHLTCPQYLPGHASTADAVHGHLCCYS